MALLFAVALGALFATPRTAAAQNVEIGGFLKTTYYYDTRQVAAARDVDYLLWPIDGGGREDFADTDNLSSFQLFSRLTFTVNELPQVLGGDVTAFMEADFFGPGTLDDSIVNLENVFRARRLFANMVWDNREVKFGLEWTPLFTIAAYPHTVATEAGSPFNPLSRQPQIRFTYKPGNFRLIGITGWTFDAFRDPNFAIDLDGDGTIGSNDINTNGIDQQQWAAIPDLHGHVQYVTPGGSLVGIGGLLHTIRPVATGERFYSGMGTVYGVLNAESFIVRAKGVYGANAHHHVMTGGYVYDPGEDPNGEFVSAAFKPQQIATGWVEVEAKGTVAPGLFAGYLANFGTVEDIVGGSNPVAEGPVVVGRGTSNANSNIEAVWDVSPRLALNYGPTRLALELQITNATFARRFNANFGPAGDTDSYVNVRGNFSVFVFF